MNAPPHTHTHMYIIGPTHVINKNKRYYDDTSTLQSKIHCVELQRAL